MNLLAKLKGGRGSYEIDMTHGPLLGKIVRFAIPLADVYKRQSEHSMIGKYIDTILPEETLPQTLTSYSPCFRKEKCAHGIEEQMCIRDRLYVASPLIFFFWRFL